MDEPARPDPVLSVIRFCRELRLAGLPVTTPRTIDTLRALAHLDLTDPVEVRFGLRSILTARQEDLAIFDRAFDTFWLSRPEKNRSPAPLRGSGDSEPQEARPPTPRRTASDLAVLAFASDERDADGEPIDTPGISDREALTSQDFSTFSDLQLEHLLRVAVSLARRLESQMRRRGRGGRSGRLDLRRTIRANLARGEIIDLRRCRRRRRPLRLVVLCDVSGSMNVYSRVLLLFLFALQQSFARIETFAFSTRLTRITTHLKGRSYRQALNRLIAVSDWSGGTRIGESLAAFNQQHGRLVDRQTLVVVLSDGWDTGDPNVLARELMAIRRRARGVIWLNPLLGRPGYEPLTRGMAAALPHIDGFAPAHNLQSLQDFARNVSLFS